MIMNWGYEYHHISISKYTPLEKAKNPNEIKRTNNLGAHNNTSNNNTNDITEPRAPKSITYNIYDVNVSYWLYHVV